MEAGQEQSGRFTHNELAFSNRRLRAVSAHRSNQHVVHESAQTPPVHSFTMACPLQYFWGPVWGRGKRGEERVGTEWVGGNGGGEGGFARGMDGSSEG